MAGKAIAYGAIRVEPGNGLVWLKVDGQFEISLSPEDALLLAQELANGFKSAKLLAFQDRVLKVMRGEA